MSELVVLAPVPLKHLESGFEKCQKRGQVAFGSQAFEFFEGLELGLPMLFYASHAEPALQPAVSWAGEYAGYLRTENEKWRHIHQIRPDSAGPEERQYWGGYYRVRNLQRLEPPVPTLSKVGGDPFSKGFIPRGPLLAELV